MVQYGQNSCSACLTIICQKWLSYVFVVEHRGEKYDDRRRLRSTYYNGYKKMDDVSESEDNDLVSEPPPP